MGLLCENCDCSGIAVGLLCDCCGIAVALLWDYCDSAVGLSLHYCMNPLCCGTAVALVLDKPGIDIVFQIVVGYLWHCRGIVLDCVIRPP